MIENQLCQQEIAQQTALREQKGILDAYTKHVKSRSSMNDTFLPQDQESLHPTTW